MKTFIFIQKNGNAVLTLSAKSEEEANYLIRSILMNHSGWGLEEIIDEH